MASERREPHLMRPVEMPPRAPSLILRRSLACGSTALCVRLDAESPWIEVSRAGAGDTRGVAELDRLQRIYADPLVREVFIELSGESP